MKYFLVFLMLLSLKAVALPTPNDKAYNFHFKPFQGETFHYEIKSESQEDAFEKAATACFQYFKKGRRISMEYGQDIIDICVNPRSI